MAKKDTNEPILIDTDGLTTVVRPKDGKNFTLGEMYDLIDTDMIQTIVVPGRKIMVMDEEGKRKGKKVNAKATAIARTAGIAPDDMVVGKVIVAPSKYFR